MHAPHDQPRSGCRRRPVREILSVVHDNICRHGPEIVPPLYLINTPLRTSTRQRGSPTSRPSASTSSTPSGVSSTSIWCPASRPGTWCPSRSARTSCWVTATSKTTRQEKRAGRGHRQNGFPVHRERHRAACPARFRHRQDPGGVRLLRAVVDSCACTAGLRRPDLFSERSRQGLLRAAGQAAACSSLRGLTGTVGTGTGSRAVLLLTRDYQIDTPCHTAARVRPGYTPSRGPGLCQR